MNKKVLKDFNEWHHERTADVNIDTPWHRFVAENLNQVEVRGKRILEIGCGRGGFACWFASKFGDVYKEFVAADFSDVAINIGKDYAEQVALSGKIRWCHEDIMNISFPSEYFDIVISCETIEHVPKPFKGVKELSRVLRKDGLLLITTPNYFNFFGLYRIYLRMTGRKWTEVGQPINKFVMVPLTLLWLKFAKVKVSSYSSKRISYPSPTLRREVFLNWKRPSWLVNWLGINSFFVGRKT